MAKQTKTKKTEPPVKPVAPQPPARRTFVLKQNVALGNGTRLRGEVVFTAEAAGKKWNPETVEKAKGFKDFELGEVLKNPQLVESV